MRTNLLGTVVFVVRLALSALEARADLGTHAHTIPNLHRCDTLSDLDSMTDHLMADAKRQRGFAPAASDGMDVRPTDPTSNDLDVNVTILKRFRFKLGSVNKLD